MSTQYPTTRPQTQGRFQYFNRGRGGGSVSTMKNYTGFGFTATNSGGVITKTNLRSLELLLHNYFTGGGVNLPL